MDNQLVNSNHSSRPNAIRIDADRGALSAAFHRACDALRAARSAGADLSRDAVLWASQVLQAGLEDEHLIATGESSREIGRQLNEYRRLCAIADQRWLDGCCGKPIEIESAAPKLWDVQMLAKQLRLAADTIRRRAREGSFPFRVLCVAHANCRGGGKGCDYRFIASEAAAWVNERRRARR